ncbi:MAG TPA: AraC family transcriptional regulator [Kofleriaceae bacterium]
MMGKPGFVTDRPKSMDPFVELIRLLRPQATLWGDIRARGRWAISFRARHDLLFFRVDRGSCLLLRPDEEPRELAPRDFVLIRTITPFTVGSDTVTKPLDSERLVAAARATLMNVGKGASEPVVIRGGRFAFDTVNENLLMDMLPSLVHVVYGAAGSERTRSLLAMNEAETLAPRPGSEFVIARLMELLLVEVLRGALLDGRALPAGVIRGLADPVIARALALIHGDVARSWTAVQLARMCGCSRSAFNQRFTSVVGVPPISYLQRWRMALAKDELRNGQRSVAEIALLIGFKSGGAFSTAFTRAVGCSPSDFVEQAATRSPVAPPGERKR